MPGHRDRDARVLNEAELLVEDRRVVVVEADDHAGHHLDAGALDAMHRVEDALAHVLRLVRLLQAGGARRLDADEDGGEVGLAA